MNQETIDRENDMQAARNATFEAIKTDIRARWIAALNAGDEDLAEAIRAEGVAVCRQHYGCEE